MHASLAVNDVIMLRPASHVPPTFHSDIELLHMPVPRSSRPVLELLLLLLLLLGAGGRRLTLLLPLLAVQS